MAGDKHAGVGVARSTALRLRPLLRRRGYDVVRYPGPRHPYVRSLVLRRLAVDLVLDVGANVGQFAQDIRAHGYFGRVISFEPMRSVYDELAAASADDARWDAVHSALAAEPGELQINVAGNSISSSLLPMAERHRSYAPLSEYVGTESVPVDRLDTLAGDAVANARAGYLKIDTQGYESIVLDGATGILSDLAAVELEMSLVPLYEGQDLMPTLIERLGDSGFRLSVLSTGLSDLKKGETLQVDGIFERV